MGRFLNADVFVSTGQEFVGYNMFAYCGNNPVTYEDQTGTRFDLTTPQALDPDEYGWEVYFIETPDLFRGTISVGITASAYCGYGGSGSAGVVLDGTGNAGVLLSANAGGGTVGYGYGGFMSFTTAPSISNLKGGPSSAVGASISIGKYSFGFEYSIFNNEVTGETYHGYTFSVTSGFDLNPFDKLLPDGTEIPFESHGGVSGSILWDF